MNPPSLKAYAALLERARSFNLSENWLREALKAHGTIVDEDLDGKPLMLGATWHAFVTVGEQMSSIESTISSVSESLAVTVGEPTSAPAAEIATSPIDEPVSPEQREYRELKTWAKEIGITEPDFNKHWSELAEKKRRPLEITRSRLDKMRDRLNALSAERLDRKFLLEIYGLELPHEPLPPSVAWARFAAQWSPGKTVNAKTITIKGVAYEPVNVMGNSDRHVDNADRVSEAVENSVPDSPSSSEAEPGRSSAVYLPAAEDAEIQAAAADVQKLRELVTELYAENEELTTKLALAQRTIDTWEAALRKTERDLWFKLRDKYICAVAPLFVGSGAAVKTIAYADELLEAARPEQAQLNKEPK